MEQQHDSDDWQLRRFQFTPGALQEDALRRGLTATLYIVTGQGEQRCFLLVNHTTQYILSEVISAEMLRALFGSDEPGIYEIVVKRVFEDRSISTADPLDS